MYMVNSALYHRYTVKIYITLMPVDTPGNSASIFQQETTFAVSNSLFIQTLEVNSSMSVTSLEGTHF